MRTMNFNLEGRVALVCGASKGMGFATAQALTLHGAKVLMVTRDISALDAATKTIVATGGVVAAYAGDVRHPDLAQFAVDRPWALSLSAMAWCGRPRSKPTYLASYVFAKRLRPG